MNDATDTSAQSNHNEPDSIEPDPIDAEAAEIDARSPDAPQQIEELVEHAEALGRDAELPGDEDRT